MITLHGKSQRFCGGMGRRDFLRIGGLGVGGLGLADVLRLRAESPRREYKSVIMIVLTGGPSHIDLYDLKPDAPVEYRGELKPIRTSVPGFDISELLPLQAKIAQKFAVIRSLAFRTRPPRDHDIHELFSGFVSGDRRPPLGSVVSRLRGDISGALPSYVSMGGYIDGCAKVRPPEEPQYAGLAHAPFMTTGRESADMHLAADVNLARLGDRRELLRTFDDMRRDFAVRGELAGCDEFTRRALTMITAPVVRDAFDLSREPDRLRESYGPDLRGFSAPWTASKFILARRLVEAGVPVVTLCYGNWDHHGVRSNGPGGGIYERLREEAPRFDRAFHALITDLDQRGILNDVAVVVWGEMGRTPRINQQSGRDHWQESGCALLAGGGLKVGQVIGATDRNAVVPRTTPITPQHVLATLYRLLGIDTAATIPNFSGRPMHLLDDREPVAELL